MPTIDPTARAFIDQIHPDRRVLFDRLHDLILTTYPNVRVTIVYRMPTYKVGTRRLHLGVWDAGITIYALRAIDTELLRAHPALRGEEGRLQLCPRAAAAITDSELTALLQQALG